MKLFVRYFAVFVTTVVLTGITVHNLYFKAGRLDMPPITTTIGRYKHPQNATILGLKEFRFAKSTFNLFTRLNDELEAGEAVDNISIVSYTKHLKPVTAVSSNHFIELIARVDVMAKFMPANVKIAVYDLGLTENEVETLKNTNSVEYRIFDFPSYPTFVKRLENFAWKALIIQKILSEFGGALWMDSSVVFQDSYEKIVRYMVEKNSSFLYYLSRAGNTVISGSEPRMFEFLPMKGTKQITARMPQAGGILMYNTALARRDIMKWVLACCLEEHCIAPSGSTHECGDNYPPDTFGGCHSFDQSLLAIVVSNAYDSQEERYTLPNNMSEFAYPWRIRNDNLLLCREFVIVYVVWAAVVGLMIIVTSERKCVSCDENLRFFKRCI